MNVNMTQRVVYVYIDIHICVGIYIYMHSINPQQVITHSNSFVRYTDYLGEPVYTVILCVVFSNAREKEREREGERL